MTKILGKYIAAVGLSFAILLNFFLPGAGNTNSLGANSSIPDAQWMVVNQFQGFQTKTDPAKIAVGANPNGQNTEVNNGDRISVREFGYETLGTATTSEDGITSLHTFRKRSGENILMRSRGTYLEYFEEGGDTWESLRSNGSNNAIYGYADYNINTDLRSYVYFGNAVDNFARWTGAHTTLSGAVTAGGGSLPVVDTTDFFATGTVRYCDNNIVYTSKTLTSITVTGTLPVSCASGRGVTQAIEENAGNPKGNIYLVANNRIFISGVTSTPQAIFFSKYGDAMTYLTTLVAENTADAAGIFNLGEGGGAVTGMAQDEGAIYLFKKSIIYKATLSDSLYTLQALKPFDGKSQTTGASNPNQTFSDGNAIYFVTADNQIMSLSRVSAVDYPQTIPISDPIKPTVDSLEFDSGAGIAFRDKAYFSAQSDPDGLSVDTVLVWNSRTSAWMSPIVGWAASAFAVYDDGTGEMLYFGDANTANVYKLTAEDKLDNDLAFTASWRSKRFDFGELGIPTPNMKEMVEVWVEGYITENTTLNASLLLDEDGYTQSFTTQILGSNTALLFNAQPFNVFGLHPFGYLPFGTADAVEKKKFRVYLNRDFRALPFYTAQLEFTSDDENNYWEITSFGFRVREATQPEKRTLYKQFN